MRLALQTTIAALVIHVVLWDAVEGKAKTKTDVDPPECPEPYLLDLDSVSKLTLWHHVLQNSHPS